MQNRLILMVSLFAAGLLASACANTVSGVGQDVSRTVDATEGAVRDIAN